MSGGMPELGSKISLISKADIRYEGRLFTVDPTECTIALANVRSYGTEDRNSQYQVAPQNQVYDYILFRGSDIKDIRVVNIPPLHNDPAIMQMQLPNQMPQQTFQPPQFQVPNLNLTHINQPAVNQYATAGGGATASYNAMSGLSNLTPVITSSTFTSTGLSKPKQTSELNMNNVVQDLSSLGNLKEQQASVLDLIGGGSRSTTPISLTSRKSPTTDMGVQVNQASINKDSMNKMNNARSGGSGDRRDSGRMDNHYNYDRNNQRYQYNGNNQNRGWNRGLNQRGNRQRMRGNNNNQVFRQSLGNQNNKGRPKTVIKFDNDFDFEQANHKFEELRLEFTNKKSDETKTEQLNGETDKKDDSGNETGAGEHEPEEEEVVGYDKSKSFFDNISCEAATDRTKGKNRTDWRHERKINTETFGVSSARRGGFFNYRGRGGGGGYYNRNMNMGGGYRGNGGYRGGNFRGRNMNNRQQNQNNNTGNNPTFSQKTQDSPSVTTTDK